ncbi:hypothetical protein RKLH11_1996 [Rhodobacteraceae bacterium KLH11]|nr:hypothetical protein RKLH11_1996 [Rhodobacteraceae bacterium KLH11]
MHARTNIDGTVTLKTEDGRRFIVAEADGTFTVESMDGEVILHPISRTKFEIDTPLT